MKLISIENINKNEWSRFLLNNKSGNIFQSPEMYEVFRNTKNYLPLFLGVVDSRGDILGLLISVIQKEWSGLMEGLTSRCISWGGPVLKHDLEEMERKNLIKFILTQQDELLRKKAIYMQFRNLIDITEYIPFFEQNGYKYEDELNVLIDLTKGEETLWNEFHRKRRTGIRKAEKEGITTVFTNRPDDIEAIHDIYSATYKHAKHPLADASMFSSANNIFSKKKSLVNILAQLDGHSIGAMTLLTDKKTVYAWYLGGYIEHRNKHPNDLLPWVAMKWGIENKFEIFDFLGAGKPNEKFGIRDFKIKFGGDLVNLGRLNKVFKKTKLKIAMAGLKLLKNV